MATAKRIVKDKQKVERWVTEYVDVPPTVLLELSLPEAEMLCSVTYRTGGFPNGSRGHMDAIRRALVSAGVARNIDVDSTLTSDLYFSDGSAEPQGRSAWHDTCNNILTQS